MAAHLRAIISWSDKLATARVEVSTSRGLRKYLSGRGRNNRFYCARAGLTKFDVRCDPSLARPAFRWTLGLAIEVTLADAEEEWVWD